MCASASSAPISPASSPRSRVPCRTPACTSSISNPMSGARTRSRSTSCTSKGRRARASRPCAPRCGSSRTTASRPCSRPSTPWSADMAVLDILTYPDARLTQESQSVTAFDDELRDFIANLEETLRAGPGAVGIAAPQVGRAERIVLEAFNEWGERAQFKFECYEARAVQHEIDHLDGLLFLDRLFSRRNDLFRRKVYKR